MQPYHSKYVQIGEQSLHLLCSDTYCDSWLVLWPGICMTAEQFLPVLASAVDKPFNVVIIDPPGHGLSELWAGEFTEQSIQTIWKTIADELDIHHAVIGGHSYGAMSALMSDTILQDWVEAVILLDAGYNVASNASDEDLQQGLEGYLHGYRFESWEAFVEEEKTHVQQWDDLSERIARATMRETDGIIALRVHQESAAKAYRLCSRFAPTHVVHSDKEVLLLRATLPKEQSEDRDNGTAALAGQLTNLTVIDVPNSGHDVLMDNRNFVIHSLWTFISQVYFGNHLTS